MSEKNVFGEARRKDIKKEEFVKGEKKRKKNIIRTK